MKLQGRNLERGLTGADVSLLHFELELIGYPPPEDEVANNTFGPGTQQAVQKFQAGHKLKQSGVVDKETAKAINAQVAQLPIDDVLARLGEEIARYQAQIDQLRQGSANLDKEVARLRAALEAMQMACDQVKAEAAASAQQVAGLQEALSAAQARIGDLEQSLAAARARIVELEKLIEDSNGGKSDSFVVRGQVLRSDTQPVADATVQAMHAGETGAVFLNSGKTTPDGRYEITYTLASLGAFGPQRANLVVQVLGPDQAVLVASAVRPEAGPVEVIDLEVKVTVVPKDGFVVQGHVRRTDGTPLAGLTVVAWDVDLPSLGQNEQLGRQPTGEDGFYKIAYTADQFSRAEKASADLQVSVYPTDTWIDDKTPPLAASATRYNASQEETIDLVVAAEQYRGQSEFERLLAEIKPLRVQVEVADLSDADVDFLAGETGENRLYLEFLVAAHQHANTVTQQVDAAAFYGLMREGLPAELMALLAQPLAVHRDALKRAVAENIIPAALGDQVDAIAAALQVQRVRTMLQPPGAQGPSNLSAILSAALPPVEQQAAFLSLYHVHQGDIEQFWDELPKQPGFEGDGVVSRLQYILQLNVLTGGHAPLIQALAADAALGSTRALIDLDVVAWRARIAATGADGIAQIPAHIKGNTGEEKIANYAGAIVETLKAAFSSEYLVKAIEVTPDIDLARVRQVVELNPALRPYLRQPLPKDLNWGQMPEGDRQKTLEAMAALRAELNAFPQLGTDEALSGQGFQNWIRAGVQTFLAQAGNFDFGKDNIDDHREENGDGAFGNMDEKQRETVVDQLKAFQRVYQVVPRDDSIMALMSAGLHSGMVIADVPEQIFIDTLGPQVGGKLQARFIHENARDLRDRATLALGSAIQYTSEIYPRAVWEPQDKNVTPAAAGVMTANRGAGLYDSSRDLIIRPPVPEEVRSLYATLFGRLNLCACEYCRSVYSPAAYLVDLLHFLDRRVTISPSGRGDLYSPISRRRPLDVLLARRPDLQYIALTCDNTNTALPYIDLVNEILETYIVDRTRHDATITSDRRLHTSADLLANPQHVNSEAYNRLKDAVYPLTLPFDRDLEIVRTYLAHLGTSRFEVLKAIQANTPPDSAAATDMAFEYLKISRSELRAFPGENPSPIELGRLYGYDSSASTDWMVRLENVETFLERTQIGYEDLVELLKTRFINPIRTDGSAPIRIGVQAGSCDLANRFLTSLRDVEWDALRRYIRLWRKLGWPIHDVDRALIAFDIHKASHVNEGFLARLGQAVQVKNDLNLGLAETLSFWGNIDTHDVDPEKRPNDSLYARLLLNPAVRTLAGDSNPFALDSAGDELVNTSQTLESLAPAVLAALRLTAADLPFLLALAGLNGEALVNLDNLTTLHRHAVLARALRISVKDLATLRDFVGLNPFADPATTLRFIKKARKLLASRFSPAQMAYLYWHVDEPARPFAPRPEEVTARLLALRAALQQLAQDLGPADATEVRLRAALGQVMDQARSDAVMHLLDRSVVYATTLTTPPGVTFPEPLRSRISYDAGNQMLRISGPMTTSERGLLLGLGGADGYPDAVRDLYNQSRGFFEQARLVIERELVQFIPYDEAVAQLIENEALDAAGRQAFVLERLLAFLSRSLVAQTLASSLGLDPVIADLMLTTVLRLPGDPGRPLLEDFLVLHGGAPDERPFTGREWAGRLVAPATESFTFIVRSSRPVRMQIDGEEHTGAGSAAELRVQKSLQAGMVYDLRLSYADASGPYDAQLAWESRSMPRAPVPADRLIPATVWTNAASAFVLLHKAALLVNGFRMTAAEVAYLAAHAAGFDGFTFAGLPIVPYADDEARQVGGLRHFGRWERLCDLFTLRDSLAQPERLLDVFAAPDLNKAKDHLAAATGWDRLAVDEATGPEGFGADLAFFQDERGLLRLASCLALARRIGVSPVKLFRWSRSEVDGGQAQEVRDAVKARYQAAEWLAVAKGLNDPLRERQRDALVAYILAQSTRPNDARTSMELFEQFLIDVDMSSCLPTSRIKQAISSVQLFVQRCLMNLEPEVSPALLPADQWKWMRNYRVWEANRKVFLYPENWIEPELRDDKSPFFKDLENELLQNDLTDETAEAAFLGYLEKLDEVARLDVRGMCWEHESEASRWDDEQWTDPRERADILHVFARTQGTPPIYYYRKLVNHKQWTPWEKLQADIEGDHLIPVVYNRRLYLFWPIFREKPIPEQALPQQNERPRQPEKRLEIQLASCEYKEGKWSAKVVTDARIDAEYAPPEWRSDFFFKARQDGENLALDCLRRGQQWTVTALTDPPQTTTAIIRPGAMGPSFLREAILAPIEQAVREIPHEYGSSIPFWLATADDFRKSASQPGLSMANWEARLRRIFELRFRRHLYDLQPVSGYVIVGSFTLTGCDRETHVSSVNRFTTNEHEWPVLPDTGVIDGQRFRVNGDSLLVRKPDRSLVPVLGNADDERIAFPSYILSPHQYYPYLLQAPFFYRNGERTYFATPEQVANVAEQVASQRRVILALPPISLLVGSTGDAKRSVADPVNQSGAHAVAPAIGANPGVSDRVTWDDTQACVGNKSREYVDSGSPPALPNQLKLRLHPFFHPYVCEFVKRLKRRSIPGLLALEPQKLSDFTHDGTDPDGDSTHLQFNRYHPQRAFVDLDYPKEDVDFSNGAYAHYNWELFFHAPLLIADRLSKNQRFEEARQWFHYILDPTTSSTERAPQRYWNVLPFYTNYLAPRDQIGELLYLLSYRDSDPETLRRKEAMEAQVEAWRSDPFNPHHIARMRITAYQKTVLMKYIDNLIAWGDQLFQQDTMESINQATQLYILAYLLLGPRPKIIPPESQPVIQTFYGLRCYLDDFSNALVATENAVAGRRCVSKVPTGPKGATGSPSLGVTLYFCIPPNDKLLGYWDTVEDRLFKIRHCMNIEGVVRQLPLFEPPIDPALLVRARAAGLDLSRVLNDINAALPHYRFNIMLQKALELCGEVRSLGAALLSALEKRDAEALSLLRSTHEIRMLEQVKMVRQKQVDEASEAIAGIEKSKEITETRRNFYRDIVQISPGEKLYMDNLGTAHVFQMIAQGIQASVSAAHMVPHFDVGIAGWAASPIAKASFGGNNLGSALRAAAEILNMIASQYTYEANMASIQAGYDRRWDEWKHQERLANKELEQIDRQMAAALIRHEIAAKELENHDLQIENARAVDEFMHSKFTNRELYGWMVDQTSALYFQAYQLAYDLAKHAERAYQFERGVATSSFVRFDSWDSLHKGLVAGERLTLDLKRLEKAYMDQNRRDYEITKHVSLVLHDPLALIALKTTGQCEINLPETLFDMDYPGHFMRRVKSVSLTIPAVVGPYTSVNCTLTLLSSRIRKNASRPTEYAENASGDDDRFLHNFAPLQSIATSHGQNDSGLFELNFRDERYLPFEGAGGVSTWRIELPPDCNAFDLDTITDVVMRINYTARDGGDSLRNAARTSLGLGDSRLRSDDRRTGEFQRLFSLKHEFAVEWAQFLQAPGVQQLRFGLTRERFPFQFRGRTISIQQFDVFLVPTRHERVLPTAITLTRPDGSPVTRTVGTTSTPDWPLAPLYDLPHAAPVVVVEPALSLGENAVWTLGMPEGVRVGAEQLGDILLVCTFQA